jgi:phage shock protein A
MENDSLKLDGMSAAEAKDYILSLITTLKLTEKGIRSLEEEAAKWKSRLELARSSEKNDLAFEAEKEAGRVEEKIVNLREEEKSLKDQIEEARRQLPGLAARERSIDADLLEQKLLFALGQTEEETETERAFKKLEREFEADSALEALKKKLEGTTE